MAEWIKNTLDMALKDNGYMLVDAGSDGILLTLTYTKDYNYEDDKPYTNIYVLSTKLSETCVLLACTGYGSKCDFTKVVLLNDNDKGEKIEKIIEDIDKHNKAK